MKNKNYKEEIEYLKLKLEVCNKDLLLNEKNLKNLNYLNIMHLHLKVHFHKIYKIL